MVGQGVEDTVARTGFNEYCLEWIQNGTIGTSYLLTISQNGNPLLDPTDASNAYQACTAHVNQTMPFVVWPVDGTKTNSIQILMTSY